METTTEPLVPVREYYTETTDAIQIEVVPSYVKDRSSPDHHQFFYAYKLRITNHTDRSIQLTYKHFKVKDGKRPTYDIQGMGLSNERPVIGPSQYFEFNGFVTLHAPHGNMRGNFQFIDEFENHFWANVPLFFFRPPSVDLH